MKLFCLRAYKYVHFSVEAQRELKTFFSLLSTTLMNEESGREKRELCVRGRGQGIGNYVTDAHVIEKPLLSLASANPITVARGNMISYRKN